MKVRSEGESEIEKREEEKGLSFLRPSSFLEAVPRLNHAHLSFSLAYCSPITEISFESVFRTHFQLCRRYFCRCVAGGKLFSK